MASGGTSLRFSVVVAADQAEQALKALTVAFNQAGVSAKTSMAGIAPAARAAGAEVITLGDRLKTFAREQRQEARTAGFFVGELANIVPVSNAAKGALVQLGGALVGGGVVGIGIAAATTAVGILTRAWEEEKKAAEEASAAEAKAAKERQDRLNALGKDATSFKSSLEERVAAARREAAGVRELATAADWARVTEMKHAALLPENAARRGLLNKRITETIALLKELDELNAQIEAKKGKKGGGAEASAPFTLNASTASSGGFYNIPNDPNQRVTINPMLTPGDVTKSRGPDPKLQREYNAEVQRSVALNQEWGSAIGGAIGALATGQATAMQVVTQIGQMIVQSVVQSAIASITADAARAGAGAAASQAGIPVIGPVLAISAMGAMISTVLGLLSSLPSAAGGWWNTGGYEGLAMVHKNEMIADEPLANKIRSGGAIGGSTYNVYALDARSVERVLTDSEGAVARAERKRRRRGW